MLFRFDSDTPLDAAEAQWAPDEPDNGTKAFSPLDEDCVVLFVADAAGALFEFHRELHGRWSDQACDLSAADEFGFICQRILSRHDGTVVGDMFIETQHGSDLNLADIDALARDQALSNWPPQYWPSGEVPLKIAPGFSPGQRRVIKGITKHLERQTGNCAGGLRFARYRGGETNYLTIIPHERFKDEKMHIIKQMYVIKIFWKTPFGPNYSRTVCAATSIGMRHSEGQQKIFLGSSCFDRAGTLLHEFLHALGLAHEHQRPDRDRFIDVHVQNILTGWL